MCLCARMLALEWKERVFIEKVNSTRCFCWFAVVIFVYQNCTQIWRLHTKFYNGAWNVSANNSETVGRIDHRLGHIVYIPVFCNISFSWLLPLDGFQYIFLCRVYCVTVKTIYRTGFAFMVALLVTKTNIWNSDLISVKHPRNGHRRDRGNWPLKRNGN